MRSVSWSRSMGYRSVENENTHRAPMILLKSSSPGPVAAGPFCAALGLGVDVPDLLAPTELRFESAIVGKAPSSVRVHSRGFQ